MADTTENTIAVLNDLLAAEIASLIPRLAEAAPFVTWHSADEADLVDRIVEDQSRNAQALTREILNLKGTPEPRRADASTANVHYLTLEFLWPRLIADQRRTIALYEAAAERIPAALESARALIGTLLARHREHLAHLERLAASASSSSG